MSAGARRSLPMDEVEILSSRTIHDGPIFRLVHDRVRLPSGLTQELDVIEHPGAVAVAALDSEGRLLLVRQYRHSVRGETVEIPAGRLEPGEDPLSAARRELEEETGHRAKSWEAMLVIVPAPGFCSERIHLFRATELVLVGEGALSADPDEELELERATPAEILAGPSEDAKTLLVAALLSRPL